MLHRWGSVSFFAPAAPQTVPVAPPHCRCSYLKPLKQRSYEERDFPEARERLKQRPY